MAIVLGDNQYGKSEIRCFRVVRDSARHEIHDLNVSVALRGEFTGAHITGDQSNVLPTDTQKNTVFAFAEKHGIGEIEDFAARLARHFVDQVAPVRVARVEIEEYPWARIDVAGVDHDHGFVRSGRDTRTTTVTVDGDDTRTVSGVRGLVLLKTTGSEFRGFAKDEYTTLEETTDRILATSLTSWWRYSRGDVHSGPDIDWAASHTGIRRVLMERFADTHSYALQQTLYAMGVAVLEAHPEVAEIGFSAPNNHHFAVDLTRFGMHNPGEVFHADDRPYGLIEATVTRDDAPD